MQQILTIISVGITDGIDMEGICGTGQRRDGWLPLRVRAKGCGKKDLRMPWGIKCMHAGRGESIITDSELICGEPGERLGPGWATVFLLFLSESRMKHTCNKVFTLK